MLTRRRSLAAVLGLAAWPKLGKCLDPFRLTIGGAVIEVTFAPGDFDAGGDAIHHWIEAAAQAVSVYFGKFPVPQTSIEVRPVAGREGVFGGVTYGDPPHTKIAVGQQTTAAGLEDDWMMTHELTHLSFPDMPRQQHWIEEGIATYVEPIARAQAGTLKVERVWGDMFRDMHQGMQGADGKGLDHTRSWANTYWGGGLFCLLADVEYRKRTANKRGLQQALRGILKAGGNIQVDWPIEQAFETADKAVGVPVLTELYARYKDAPMNPDLPALWQGLGVEGAGRSVTFHEDAELAAVRRAITQKPK